MSLPLRIMAQSGALTLYVRGVAIPRDAGLVTGDQVTIIIAKWHEIHPSGGVCSLIYTSSVRPFAEVPVVGKTAAVSAEFIGRRLPRARGAHMTVPRAEIRVYAPIGSHHSPGLSYRELVIC